MTDEEKIEYYLGKDSFKNEFFAAKDLPMAYEPFSDTRHLSPAELVSTEIQVEMKFGTPEQYTSSIRLNNKGFRNSFDFDSVELNKKDGIILCMGCSDAMGPNLEEPDIWPNILRGEISSALGPNVEILNLGMYSAAPDTVSRLLHLYTEILHNVSHICIIWPHQSRREFASRDKKLIITKHTKNEQIPTEDWWKFTDWVNDGYNLNKNMLFCRYLAAAKKIQLHELFINRHDPTPGYDIASAFGAFGEKTNRALAQYFKKKILGLPSRFEESKKGEMNASK